MYAEPVNGWWTDTSMTKWKKKESQAMEYKIVHRKVNITKLLGWTMVLRDEMQFLLN